MRAYSELYLGDAQECLGEMLDFVVCDLSMDVDSFFSIFLNSGLADAFGTGHPKYIAGMSGCELARQVLKTAGVSSAAVEETEPNQSLHLSSWYWTGWILAYYQWYSSLSFKEIVACGLAPSEVESMYALHVADPSVFADRADKIIEASQKNRPTKLQTIRKLRGLTQAQLAEASGTSLRMISLYEQRKNSIDCAAGHTLARLAQALGCHIEDLLERPFEESYEYAFVKIE